MQSIQNSLQQHSAVMQGVSLVQTKLRTAAENLHAAAQGRGVIATKALTVAQWAFNAAANANPIGLLVVGIMACVGAVWGLAKAFQSVAGASEDAEEAYQRQKKSLEDLSEAHEWEMERLKELGATEAALHKKSLQQKQEQLARTESTVNSMIIKYGEDSDAYKKAVEDKEKAEEEFQKAVKDGKSYLENVIRDFEEKEREQRLGTYEYKRQLIAEELEAQQALTAELLKQGELTLDQYHHILASLEAAAQFNTDKVNDDEKKSKPEGGSRIDAAKKEAEELKKAVQEGEDALLNLISDSLERQRQAEILSYDRRLKELQEMLAKTNDKQAEMRKALDDQIKGLQAQHERTMHDLEISGIERSLNAESDFISSRLAIVKEGSEKELALKQQQLDNQYRLEQLALQKSEESKLITIEQAEEMRLDLAEKYAILREQAEQEHASRTAGVIQKKYADEQSTQDNAFITSLNALKMRYAEELGAAKGNAAEQAKINARHEEEQAVMTEEYAKRKAKASIDMLEEVLATEGLSYEQRLSIEQELAKAKVDLETAITDATIAEIERATQADNEAREKRIANARMWMQKASEAMNSINSLVSAVYDGKIDKIEEEQAAVEESSDREQTRITELVEKKVITEEEGEARKRAAEAFTARKTEELERKKATLQEKQAKWDKANSLAQAAIATALAITQALPDIVLAAIAGAMGTAQIATIVATPIPKYAKGTECHKGGPAIVGDGGRSEVVIYNNTAWITPDTPTLVDIPAGASIISDVNGIDEELFPMLSRQTANESAPVVVNNNFQRLEEKMDSFIYLLRRQTAIQHRDSVDRTYDDFKNSKL